MEPIKLSITERVSLANQYKILAKLEENNSEHYEELVEMLERGYESDYHKIFDFISDEHFTVEEKDEVLGILEMFSRIKHSLQQIPAEKLEELDQNQLSFRGFDANNDRQYSYLGWWDERNPYSSYREDLGKIGGRNSHTIATLPKYRGMISVVKQFPQFTKVYSFEQLKEIENAQSIYID